MCLVRSRPGAPVVMMVLVGVAILALGGGVAAYGLLSKPPPATTKGSQLRVPSLGQLLGEDGPCAAKVYPAGAAYRYERCSGSSPVGCPLCSRVTYQIAPAGAPSGYQTDVMAAVTRLEAATGLRLVEVTDKANISIVWDPSLYDPLPGTSGEAGVTTFRSSGSHSTSAAIRISSHLATGAAPSVGEEPILLHELGHAVGLAHFDGAEVMNPLDRGFSAYQPGDLAGLTRLYHPASCS